MREKKFRFRYTDGANWIFKVFDLQEIMNGEPFEVLSDSPLLKKYKLVGQDQYTGLKDKNGKEIYDGDVVSGTVRLAVGYDCNCLDVMEDNPFMSVVTYQNGCPGFDVHPYDCWLSMDLIEAEGIPYEIIGNIYENPELLEAK